MATIKKKPTKAHKSKKVVKAHMGMAHVPRQRPPRQTRPPTQPVRIDQPTGRPRPITPKRRPLTKAEKDQGMRYANPTGTLVSMPDPKPTRRPTRSPIEAVQGVPMPKPMDERARRRRDNALKSELDEAARRANRRPRRPTAQPIRQPRLAMPYNPAADNFPIGKPNTTVVRGLGPLRNNFNPQQSTALTDRFTKKMQPYQYSPDFATTNIAFRNKGGDVKKYAVGGLNKGMTKSRTKYGIVDNKKK